MKKFVQLLFLILFTSVCVAMTSPPHGIVFMSCDPKTIHCTALGIEDNGHLQKAVGYYTNDGKKTWRIAEIPSLDTYTILDFKKMRCTSDAVIAWL